MGITTTTTVLQPFFRDHPCEPVPEENFWTTLRCRGRLTEADTPTIRLGATPSGLSSAHLHHPSIFYRPDALPAAQPTVSSTEGVNLVESLVGNVILYPGDVTVVFRSTGMHAGLQSGSGGDVLASAVRTHSTVCTQSRDSRV